MKKRYLFIFLLLFLVGCDSSDTTYETTSEYTYYVNEDLANPIVEISETTLTITEEETATEYMIVATDITPLEELELLPNQTFHLTDSLVFDLTDLIENRVYDISVYTVSDSEISDPTIINDYLTFARLTDIETTYNINNLDSLYLYGYTFSEVYMVKEDSTIINQENYLLEMNKLFIDHDYLVAAQSTYDDLLSLEVFTEAGCFTLTINFQDITKPYIISDNEVVFEGEDLEFIFDYCNGSLDQINGSDLSTSDYYLEDNVLTIDAGFIQNLFDEAPDRNNVVLTYTLRNETDVVLGAIVISRD